MLVAFLIRIFSNTNIESVLRVLSTGIGQLFCCWGLGQTTPFHESSVPSPAGYPWLGKARQSSDGILSSDLFLGSAMSLPLISIKV